jgi:hypothetical protein
MIHESTAKKSLGRLKWNLWRGVTNGILLSDGSIFFTQIIVIVNSQQADQRSCRV